MKSTVYLLPCDSYDEEKVYNCMTKGFELMGGLDKLIARDEKILIKPNLLNGAPPEKAVSTHPAVFGSVLRYLKERSYGDLHYGDSSGVGAGDINKVVEVCGLRSEAEKYNVPLLTFETQATVAFPEGKVAKKFNLAQEVLDCDAIISVCKMKTHALESITGALKNQYGCVFGGSKALGHARYPNSRSFADMIADLNSLLKPRLFIMDGILAMEGNGPGSGDPVYMNLILISQDPVALDTVFSRLIYVDPDSIPTTVSAYESGLGTMLDDEIEVMTPDGAITTKEAQQKYGNPNFNVNRKKPRFWNIGAAAGTLRKQFDKPVLIASKCIGCGVCEEACPAEGKAVHSGNGRKAVFDYKKCIRCYCCQEMCPAKAIKRKG